MLTFNPLSTIQFANSLQVNLAPGRRDQDGFGSPLEPIFRNHLFGELPITLVGDHELYFIRIPS